MAKIRKYLQQDFGQVTDWYRARGLPPPLPADVPTTGLIADSIAAAFLIHTDSNFALFWGLVSNPAHPQQLREDTLQALVMSLQSLARDSGYKQLLGFTTQPSVRAHAAQQNYKESIVTLVLKELT